MIVQVVWLELCINYDAVYMRTVIDPVMSDSSANPVQNNVIKAYVDNALATKVDKVTGKQLSTNDFTDADKSKLDGIETGAQANPSHYLAELEVSGGTLASPNYVYRFNTRDANGSNTRVQNIQVDATPSNATSNHLVTSKGVADALADKQDTLTSGTNIKTINGESVLGSGDIDTSDFTAMTKIGEPPIRRLNVTYEGETFTIPSFNDYQIKPYLLPNATSSVKGAVVVDNAMSDSSANPVQNNVVKAYIDSQGGEVNVIESISVNGTALTPVNKAVNIQTPQYVINGNSYDIVDVTSGTLNNVSGVYLMYNNGSIDLQSGGFFPDMVGMSYASQQILSAAANTAGQLITNTGATASDIPLMDGTADVGDEGRWARVDHVHPTDTSRQATLVSGTNIKTINGTSILGSGDLPLNTLPSVTSSDNGKVLRVVSGAWSAVSLPSASGVNF